ncbi:MAG: GDP-L-fucose synthase [Candidatus Omnitrophica bacterium]|nr:GDP-L-fucose synthase [Candidatus Omnitrophota bacterium]
MIDLKNKHILVTGGAGFLGKHLVARLRECGCRNIFVPRSDNYNLVESEAVKRLYSDAQPEIVIHLAAQGGGIGANLDNPAKFFYDNLMMGALMMETGRARGIEKFVALGTVCAYPKFTAVPFEEKNFWDGYPEEINAPYALAKKILLVQSQAYRKQYGFNSIFLLPGNLYGPGDNFDLDSAHVIPALIRKCLEAQEKDRKEVLIWGTGKATREFLYVEDAAEAIILAAEQYDKSEPVNIGSGFEISIKDLVKLIARFTGFKGKIAWDKTKPDGQLRRRLNTVKAYREFGFKARMGLEEGLKRTIDWYKTNF